MHIRLRQAGCHSVLLDEMWSSAAIVYIIMVASGVLP
jgi:hypothetical protein